jgi:hypothetical protein
MKEVNDLKKAFMLASDPAISLNVVANIFLSQLTNRGTFEVAYQSVLDH